MDRYETPIDRAIREATERGEFDSLSGAGKPLNLRRVGDPDWWLKDLVEREQISPDLTVSLRREADSFPESLLDLPTEEAVRAGGAPPASSQLGSSAPPRGSGASKPAAR